ncbi:MAG: ABC transporter permease [Acidimicrobiales bacterium]|nr:ABC transporter permease [Acidimicrobiales bacterium]
MGDQLLLGLGAGSVIASLALGLVVAYRASGVVNFAHAALGMYVAFAYFELRRTGDLVLPILGLPERVGLFPVHTDEATGLTTNVPTEVTALAICLVLGAGAGLIVYLLIFRALRHAPALARVVASLGLLLYLLALAGIRFGGSSAATGGTTEHVLPARVVRVLGTTIPQDRLWLLGLTVAATLGLSALYRWTRFGLSTRAAAENEKGALLLGVSPDWVGTLNWMIAGALAGGAVILVSGAGVVRLSPAEVAFLIVPALAAALVGGFESFVITAAAGVAIGVAQSGLVKLQGDWTWLPDVGLQQGLPLVVILVTMAVRGQTLPTRGTLSVGRFPRSPRPVAVGRTAAVLVAVTALGLLTLGSDARAAIITTTIATLVCLSIVVLTGYVGQISLAPLAFAGVAAFSMVKLTNDFGVPFPIAPLLGALIAAGVGALAGLPAVRVRGLNLAIVTLAAAVAIEELIFKWDWFTGGLGGSTVPEPTLFGIDLGISARGDAYPRPAFGLLCLAVVAACGIFVAALRRSPTGLRWLAVRANERAASAAGVDVARAKLAAFAVSSFLVGLAGSLLAYQRQNLSVSSFTVFQSLGYLAVTYIGGVASIAGALLAGALTQGGLVTELTGGDATSQYQFALNGVVLIVVAIVYQDGLAGALGRLWERVVGGRLSRSSPARPRPARPRPSS